MIKLVQFLVTNPGAERSAEAWATRFAAHAGLGAVVFAFAMGLTGANVLLSAVISAVIYAIVELIEVVIVVRANGRCSTTLLWDCVLDWVAVMSLTAMTSYAWSQDLLSMVACATMATIVLATGVIRRS